MLELCKLEVSEMLLKHRGDPIGLDVLDPFVVIHFRLILGRHDEVFTML